jgi:hypothetical protein
VAERRLALARRGLDHEQVAALTDPDADVVTLAGAVTRLQERR